MYARFLDQLQAGNAIIVRADEDGPLRLRSLAILPGRAAVAARNEARNARKMLRDLIAMRRRVGKK